MKTHATLLTVVLMSALPMAGCADPTSPSASTAPSSESTTAAPTSAAIPDDFPLSDGMGSPDDSLTTARTGTGLRDLAICGTTPLRGLSTRDRMVADNSGGEAANTRELVLLGSPDEAALVARAFADLPSSCPTADGGTETMTDVRESPFGPTPASTLVQTYTFDGQPGDGATVIHVVPVGAALLVTSTYGQWTRRGFEEGVTQTADAVRRTVAALSAFGEVPTTTVVPTGTDEPSAAADGPDEIPVDFPLAAGLPANDGETRVSTPSSDGEGIGEVEMCGTVVWPIDGTAGGTSRLLTRALGPEYFDGRELVVHADTEVADNAMAAIRRAAVDCRSSGHEVWTVLDRDTGYDTVTMGLTYDNGLGSSLFQVTRVGSARLMVSTYGEGSLASLDQQADQATGTTTSIVPAMCAFTKTGC